MNLNGTDITKGKNNVSDLVLNPNNEVEKSNKDQVGGEKKDIENGNKDKSNLGVQTEAKGAQNLHQGKGGLGEESKAKKENDQDDSTGPKEVPKGGSGDESKAKKENDHDDSTGPKDVPKEPVKKENEVTAKPVREEVSRGEECDLLNRCTASNQKLVACLRVPGNGRLYLHFVAEVAS